MAARRAFPWPAAAPALLLLLLLLLLVPHSAALPSLKPGAPVLRENRVIFVKERLSAEVAQAELSRHHFAFVVGAHHSGTTLMYKILGMHNNISSLTDAPAPEDEGQHLQTVYPKAYELGSLRSWAFHDLAHLTESAQSANDPRVATHLMSNWGPYWDLQRHVLVEKSPRHVLMTRYFQQIFTPERSFFIIILRHPLGAMHMYTEPAACMRLSEYLRHWFAIHNTVVADIRHLKHAVVVQYDVLVNANRTFSVLDGLERAMGVSGGFNVSFGEFDPNKVYKPELNLTGLPPHLRSAALQMIQRRQEYAQFMAGRQLDRPAYTGASRPSSAVASPNMLNHLRITLKQVEGAHGPNASITQRLRAHLQRLEAAAADEERRHRREEVVQHGTELPVAGSERSATGRRLLEYRSDTRNGVVINRGMEHSWVPKFTRVYGEDLRAKCASVVEAYEERLLQFGYSLLDFSAVRRPTIFGSHVLGWDDELAAEAVVEAAMEPAAEAAAAAENP